VCAGSGDDDGAVFGNWVVTAEREDVGGFIVHAVDLPTAFLELHAAIHRQPEMGIKSYQNVTGRR